MNGWMRKRVMLCGLCAGLVMVAAPASAGLLKSLFGGAAGADDASSLKQRAWQLDEFTSVRLVEKESGAPDNQHPAVVDGPAMRAFLGGVTATIRGRVEPLFDAGELDALVPVLVRAFGVSRSGEDVLLLSTARRGSTLTAPTAVTARLFMQGDALELVVHDGRYDFIEAYRHGHVNPHFVFGSRTQKGSTLLHSDAATSVRADWLAMPLKRPVAVPPTAAVIQPASPPAAVNAPPSATVPGSAAAIGEEVEQRLITLKRLRDKGLITEEEYQQKRREVLQKL